ncbi:hypothetical protein [Halolamina sp.]|jgi:hypothetical protein|uniref:hypothetical protein n=1 Tax=Halolamina sp. TaxID=1940283 RepID=UPI000223B60D|nr:hypothetical protein Halar_1158 [halophilic archaeon DL31]
MGDDDMPLPATNTQTVEDDLPVVAELRPVITAIRCSENRTVFTEEENANGWLSTDLTVEIER